MVVTSSEDFVWWNGFPKGLRILLLDRDDTSAADAKLKLEKMDYIVSIFSNEKEALEAISSRMESFHVAIVEVNGSDCNESFRFLETAKGLPTVMVSDGSCFNTTMRCIELGAAEVLEKPLLEEKIKNIWQHVVAHKAFDAGGITMPKSPLDHKSANESKEEGRLGWEASEKDRENRSAQEGLPPPSTPQLERGIRWLEARDSLGPSSYSSADHDSEATCKDTGDFAFGCSESKFVDNTCNDPKGDDRPREEDVKVDPKECAMSSDSKNGHSLEPNRKEPNPNNVSSIRCGRKIGKNKMKVDWTPELHRRFVQAIEQLGIDQAIPSKILKLMKVEGLTRHNIASHLQKYRMQRKNAYLPRDGDQSWLHRKGPFLRVHTNKTIMPMHPPPKSTNYGYSQVYPAWGYPRFHPSGSHTWGYPASYPWHQESWPLKSQTRMHAAAWGCPVFSQQNDHHASTTAKTVQNIPLDKTVPDHNLGDWNLQEPQLREEVIDGAVKEAITKPWLPLPIGLKPPSMDSVLSELHHQGICSIPPN